MSATRRKLRLTGSFLLSLSVLLGLPLMVQAAEKTGEKAVSESTFETGTQEAFVSALQEIGRKQEGSFLISLTDDIVLEGQAGGLGLTAPEGTTVTILGNGHTITYGSEAQGASGSLTLGTSGGVLNLGKEDGTDQLTIRADQTHDHPDPLISVGGGGTFNLYEGVLLTGNIDTSSDAGGVDVQNGTFNMYGGTISGCESYFGTGGGVRVYGVSGKAAFNMYGGVIENNKALKGIFTSYSDGGGVLVMGEDAEFTMYDGTIQGNQVSYRGGGVCNYMGRATIKGGTIAGNVSGAGEHNKKGYGGGICNYYGSTVIEGGTIEGNQGINGGGLCAYGVNYKNYTGVMDISGCTIQNNTASDGGGILAAYSSDVKISDSIIRENTAVLGGGIRMASSEVLAEDGTVIRDNTADGENAAAGGIYFDNDGLLLSGKIVVQDNKWKDGEEERENNVYFMYDQTGGSTVYQTVKVAGSLAGSQIGVTEQGVLEGKDPSPAFSEAYNASNSGLHPDQCFTSDDPDWKVFYSKDGRQEARLGKAVQISYAWAGEAPEGVVLPGADRVEKGTAYTAKESPADTEEYRFSGWYTEKEGTNLYQDGTVLEEDLTLYGKWERKTTPVPPTAGAYKVEHYKEKADGTYTLAETEFPLYGELGATVTAVPKTYKNYLVNQEKSVLSGTVTEPVEEEGEIKILVLQVYYDLKEIQVSYEWTGDAPEGAELPEADTIKAGTAYTAKERPADTEEYRFLGWYTEKEGMNLYQDGTVLEEDLTLYGKWERKTTPVPPTAGAYKVEHYKEKADGTYTLAETEFPLYGELGATVTAVPKTYKNYLVNQEKSVLSGTVTEPVEEEGEIKILVLQVYYDLKEIQVSYQWAGDAPEGAELPEADTIKAGTAYTAKERPADTEEYRFSGWYTEKEGMNLYQDGTVLEEDLTLYGKWEKIETEKPVEPTVTPDPTVTPEPPVTPDPTVTPSPEEPESVQPEKPGDTPATGDNGSFELWLVILSVSAGAGLLIFRKKEFLNKG